MNACFSWPFISISKIYYIHCLLMYNVLILNFYQYIGLNQYPLCFLFTINFLCEYLPLSRFLFSLGLLQLVLYFRVFLFPSLFFLYLFEIFVMPIILLVTPKVFNKHNYLNKVSSQATCLPPFVALKGPRKFFNLDLYTLHFLYY